METLNKEQEIDFIAGRISDEQRKHSHWNKDWHKIAASKIHSQWKEYWVADKDKRIEEMEQQLSVANTVIDLVPPLLYKLKREGNPIELYAIIDNLHNYRKSLKPKDK